MPPNSFKDLSKALNAAVVNGTLPLPDDLVETVQAYLDKHEPLDDSDAQRVHEELIAVYQKEILLQPQRLASFIAILRLLRPAIGHHSRLLQWWDLPAVPIQKHIGHEKKLAEETRAFLGAILTRDEDDAETKREATKTATVLSARLMEMWLQKAEMAASGDRDAEVLQGQLQLVLVEYGRKSLKDFMTTLNKFFLKLSSRSQVLHFLSDFIRQNPPHLYLLLQTPLWVSLLRCLERDMSTTIMSQAVTVVVMLLPHIPNSVMKHLPSLFNIYTRLLFWERVSMATQEYEERDPEKNVHQEETQSNTADWQIANLVPDADSDTLPELVHLFTFLYGLYPLNFMSYIRKPGKYLRDVNFSDGNELDVQSSEVRERSEAFRRVHLLHPNFFAMTIDSEINDSNRFMKAEAADLTAMCYALYCPAQPEEMSHDRHPSDLYTASTTRTTSALADSHRESKTHETSWRNTTSTMVESPYDERELILDVDRLSVRATHEEAIPEARLDSPTLPPQRTKMAVEPRCPTPATNSDSRSNRFSTSETSFISETKEGVFSGQSGDYARLQRDNLLLKNELNFERYLKQQHLNHIGHLRTRNVRQATVEAETQNLVNANRTLKSKLDEARLLITQTKKEADKSRSHARKWEQDLTTKLRALKDEQRKWTQETERLDRDLSAANTDIDHMRRLIVEGEAEQLRSQQRLQSIDSGGDVTEKLQKEIEMLTAKIRAYEAREAELDVSRNNEALARSKAETLELKLKVAMEEHDSARKANLEEIAVLQHKLANISTESESTTASTVQTVIDSALASSRTRLLESQKAHSHLLKRFTALEAQLLDLQVAQEKDEPLLAGDENNMQDQQTGDSTQEYNFRDVETAPVLRTSANRGGLHQAATTRPPLGTYRNSNTSVPLGTRSPLHRDDSGHHDTTATWINDAHSIPRPHAPTQTRMYGRGGVQNLSSTRNKKEKEKKKEDGDRDKDKDKNKKPAGPLRSFRGLVG